VPRVWRWDDRRSRRQRFRTRCRAALWRRVVSGRGRRAGALVVVEVLSPSTRGGDLTRKLVAYSRIPSVQRYPVFWADRPQVVHHRRRDDGQGVETRMLTEGEIRLDRPGISMTLAEIYGG